MGGLVDCNRDMEGDKYQLAGNTVLFLTKSYQFETYIFESKIAFEFVLIVMNPINLLMTIKLSESSGDSVLYCSTVDLNIAYHSNNL